MAQVIADRRDIDFVLHEQFEAETLFARCQPGPDDGRMPEPGRRSSGRSIWNGQTKSARPEKDIQR